MDETPLTPTIVTMFGKLIESVDEIKVALHYLQRELDSLKKEVHGLRQDVDELKQEVRSLREEMDDLKKEVRVLRQDVDSLRHEFDEFKTQTEKRFDDNDEAHQLILTAISEPFLELQRDFHSANKSHRLRLDALEARVA